MFASKTKKDLKFGEETITVRKLSGNEIDRAHEVKSVAQIANLRAMGGDVLKAIRSEEVAKAAAAVKADPRKRRLDALDRATVLAAGICSLASEQISDLEEVVAQEVFEAIVDLTYGTEADSGKD